MGYGFSYLITLAEQGFVRKEMRAGSCILLTALPLDHRRRERVKKRRRALFALRNRLRTDCLVRFIAVFPFPGATRADIYAERSI